MDFEDPWNVDSDYNSAEYVLSGGQRAFIATGESPYDKKNDESHPKERIPEITQQLPRRIQDLIDDVALLAYGDYLGLTTWEEIRDVDGRAEGVHHPADFFFTHPESANPDVQFGFEIGSMMSALSQTTDGNPDWTDFVWGVILGFIGGEPGKGAVETEAIDDLVDTLEARASEREHLSPRQQSGVDFLLRQHEEGQDVIKGVLETYDITPVDALVSSIRTRLRERGDPITEDLVQEFIETEIDHSRLKLVDDIYQDVTADAETIIEEGFSTSKVTAEEMLRPVWESESPTSQLVAEEAGYPSSGASLATGVLDRLSRTEGKELWTTSPVVKGDQGGWKMTAYGTVVAKILFESDAYRTETPFHERESTIDWLYEYGIDPDQVGEDRCRLIEKLRQEGHTESP